jgi:ribosomal-protein-alanine N-acetyltransferase
MTQDVVLTTARLVLRPLKVEDARDIERLAGAYEVAYNTLMIPHPYPAGSAETWIRNGDAEGRFAIALRENGELAGMIGLCVVRDHDRGELGYWIGVPYWGRGYACEAAGAIIDYGFDVLKLNKVYAAHFDRNPASGRVLQKAGMTYEGTLRQHHKKWGEYVDILMYSKLRNG